VARSIAGWRPVKMSDSLENRTLTFDRISDILSTARSDTSLTAQYEAARAGSVEEFGLARLNKI